MKKKTAKIIIDAAIVIFSLLLIASAAAFVAVLREYGRGENVYSDMLENAVVMVEAEEDIDIAESASPSVSEKATEEPEAPPAAVVTDALTDTAAAGTTAAPAKKQSRTLKVDFAALKAINADIIAWIYSPDTPISYPVVKSASEDDYEYYLRHLPDGTYNKLGSIFTDCRGEPFECLNTILYGHNMLNSSMFSTLLGYRKQSYYDAHPYVYIVTAEKTHKVILFAAMTVKASQGPYTVDFDGSGQADTWPCESGSVSESEYAAFIADLSDRSDFIGGPRPTSESRIVTLSTCDNSDNSSRYVVYGYIED